ncbi:DNA-binding response regulator [Niastella vici]|uniref:DNA-binding response regulator n=1 Tax=Niastella vici TaxID=1703345 RepID=A0A1V9FTU4_9BACT|nr:response regulator transcription factor [Niastella vici]OQP61799.1 DNA-binding response regulator [Niastella vici]
MKILIVEDEPSLNKAMVDYLHHQQYLCESVNNFHDALEKTESYEYDCIVLDIMLPGGNGLELLRQLKANKKTEGVIIISARNELDDKLNGLQLGADDYLTKPFHLPELSARIAAIIRRKNLQGSTIIKFEEIEVDVLAKIVTIQGKEITLTRKEYDMLLYFLVNRNRVLSKDAIASHLWGADADLAENLDFIYTHVKNLRKKLLQYGAGDYIHSVYGMGYKFSLK